MKYFIYIISFNSLNEYYYYLMSLGKKIDLERFSTLYSHTIQSLYYQANSVISKSQVHSIQTVRLIEKSRISANWDPDAKWMMTTPKQANLTITCLDTQLTLCNQAWTFPCLCNCNGNKAPNTVYNLKTIIWSLRS